MAAFCAICAADIKGEPRRQPLGRNGALVNVCAGCDEDAPVSRCSERGYVAAGSALGARKSLTSVRIGAQRRSGLVAAATATARAKGFVLVRVPVRGDDGKPRDQNEARATLAHQPWAADLRYLSTAANFHLFERPGDPVKDVGDQLAALERHRVKP